MANPKDYFEMTFYAEAGLPYRLWLRGKAESEVNNDSVYVQFSGSLAASGQPDIRIGTTAAAVVILEDCYGCGLSGWGWQDNGYEGLGPLIFFSQTGTQTVRIQSREDGLSVDQILLSKSAYLNSSPGSLKDDSIILYRSGAPLPNKLPTLSISASSTSGIAPMSVSFTSRASDSDGQIVAYDWSFGNGQTSTASAPKVTYSASGVFTARLKVTDSGGATASASLSITVQPAQSGGSTTLKVLSWNIEKGT
ncbi:MAG: PKD domain-containing protein, partial [Pyrinomonadaceae bacterium]